MPLIITKPDEAISNVIRGHLEQRAIGSQFRTAQLRNAAPQNLSLAAPHPVYNLGLDSIGSSNVLNKAMLTAWSYIILDGEQSIATAEALPTSASGTPVFAQTYEGPMAVSFGTAIGLAEKLPELASKTYELAVIRIPALYLTAIWLKGPLPDASDDLFIPLNPAPKGLKAEKKMKADAFLKALAKLKAERSVTNANSN